MSDFETLTDFLETEDLSYAMIVGKQKDGEKVAAFFGNPDDFQIIGMARYIYDITRFSPGTFEDTEEAIDEDENW